MTGGGGEEEEVKGERKSARLVQFGSHPANPASQQPRPAFPAGGGGKMDELGVEVLGPHGAYYKVL